MIRSRLSLRPVLAWLLVLLASVASAEVVTYPAPPDVSLLSSDYVVEADGKPVPVYHVMSQWQDRKCSVATFDFRGPVTVKIKTARSLDQLAILPAEYGIKPVVAGGEATFTTDRPFKISFEPTGCDSPLLIFGNEVEQDAPKPACYLPSDHGNTGSRPCKSCPSPAGISPHAVKAAGVISKRVSRATSSGYVGTRLGWPWELEQVEMTNAFDFRDFGYDREQVATGGLSALWYDGLLLTTSVGGVNANYHSGIVS